MALKLPIPQKKKKLEKWEYFEEKVRVFLDALGFQDIESGQSSWMKKEEGRYQIDVVGGYDGTFLVFECKSSSRSSTQQTLTQIINIFAGKKTEIEQAIREKFGTKYNEVKFILALDDIEISKGEKETARKNNIFIWGNNYLKTGEELFQLIGPLA